MTENLGKDLIKVLVEGNKLSRVDILLTRSKRNLLGWLIRFGTKSYWNHALMVYVISDKEQGYTNTFIIESGGGGIDIHNIAHYLERTDRVDIGIKRLEKPWFTSADGLRYARRIRGFALEEIDDKYNYKMILGIARRLLRQLILGVRYPWLRLKPAKARRLRLPGFAKKLEVNAYICSGFVWWSYYKAVKEILKEDGVANPEKVLEEVIFNPEAPQSNDEETLLSTTPQDLAASNKLSWKYIIKDRTLWEIGDGLSPAEQEQEVEKILKGKA